MVPTRESLSKLQPFAVLGSSIAKTGLGSSAALVSSFTATFLAWAFAWQDQAAVTAHLGLIHNVAQVAHCQAQGKVGSGFDVAAALFGSQHYVKFAAASLNEIMTSYTSVKSSSDKASFLTALQAHIDENWLTSQPKSVALPRGLSMVLGECGKDMNTPTSVRQVLGWASSHPEESKTLFGNLNSNNLHIIDLMTRLSTESVNNAESYDRILQECAGKVAAEWQNTGSEDSETRKLLVQLRDAFRLQRQLMQSLGKNTDTPIEPEEIARVLDATEKVAGVMGCGAPGAGGYDAVYALYLAPTVFKPIETLWLNWTELPMSCLCAQEDGRGAILEIRN